MRSIARWSPLLALMATLAGCAGGPYGRAIHATSTGDYSGAVVLFYDELRQHPASQRAWRELGVAYYYGGDQAKAVEALNQANRIAPDARAHLFLGIISESAGDLQNASELYRYALALAPGARTTRLLRAHLQAVERQRVAGEIRQAVADERRLGPSVIPDNTVAVYPFDGSGLSPDLAPLATGLAELTLLDLAKVKALRVVERLKIETLFKELSLDTLKAVYRPTAPRLGWLVGGRHVVTGALSATADGQFQLQGGVVDASDSSAKILEMRGAEPKRFFDVQKSFLMRVVGELGQQLNFELTREERDAIQKHPTENLMALLAYSRGLNLLGANDLVAAEAEFARARQLDPQFAAAAERAEQVSELLSAQSDHIVTLSEFAAAADRQSGEATDQSLAAFEAGAALGLGLIPAEDWTRGIYRGSPNNPTLFYPGDLTRVTVRGNLDP